MEAKIDDTWERNDKTPVIVKVIDRDRDLNNNWQVRVATVGPSVYRWWMPEDSLFRRYRQVVESETAIV